MTEVKINPELVGKTEAELEALLLEQTDNLNNLMAERKTVTELARRDELVSLISASRISEFEIRVALLSAKHKRLEGSLTVAHSVLQIEEACLSRAQEARDSVHSEYSTLKASLDNTAEWLQRAIWKRDEIQAEHERFLSREQANADRRLALLRA